MFLRWFAGVLLAAASLNAAAEIGTIDQVPAATLLFPHFEVDTSSPDGVTTVLTLQNASASAAMANVTLWTDFGLPTAQFNVYLTGYDAETVDLGLVFRRVLPITAGDGQDNFDTISPQGPFSQDINFPFCGDLQTLYQGGSHISRSIVQAHTGQLSQEDFGVLCGSRNLGDGVARGYVTVDSTNRCTTLTPADAGYFANSGGVADNRNILLGDYVIVDPGNDRVFAETAVHIEADASNPLTQPGPNKQTFYARFVGFGAIDNREPLPTAWAGRYAADRTDVDYWRDPGAATAPFACGGAPAGLPSGQRRVSVFGADGGLTGLPSGDLFPFVQGTTPGDGALGLNQPLGWLFVNLNLSSPVGPLGSIRQSWLSFRQVPRSAPPGFGPSYYVPGVQLGNAAFLDDPVAP